MITKDKVKLNPGSVTTELWGFLKGFASMKHPGLEGNPDPYLEGFLKDSSLWTVNIAAGTPKPMAKNHEKWRT